MIEDAGNGATSEGQPTAAGASDTAHPRMKKPIRFKKDSSDGQRHHHHRRHHHGHHRRSRFKPRPYPGADDTVDQPLSTPSPPRSPTSAFRESLFDALADDEGAAYWENVYGQPIHIYPRPNGGLHSHNTADPARSAGQDEDLAQLDDEEYASYVRRKMWERSDEAIEQEREKRRREKQRQRQAEKDAAAKARECRWRDGAKQGHEGEKDEASQHRKSKRRRADDEGYSSSVTGKQATQAWQKYIRFWEDNGPGISTGTKDKSSKPLPLNDFICWPSLSLSHTDIFTVSKTSRNGDGNNELTINAAAIKQFFRHAPLASTSAAPTTQSRGGSSGRLAVTLKRERVRWHPDKVQQRLHSLMAKRLSDTDSGTGSGRVELETVMKLVTAVFQVIDRLYREALAEN